MLRKIMSGVLSVALLLGMVAFLSFGGVAEDEEPAEAPSVSIEFGIPNQGDFDANGMKKSGLSILPGGATLEADETYHELFEIKDEEGNVLDACRWTPKGKYMRFQLDDQQGEVTKSAEVTFTVEFYDFGGRPMFEYNCIPEKAVTDTSDTHRGVYERTFFGTENNGQLVTNTIDTDYAQFRRAQNGGADIRLSDNGGGTGVYIKKITITKGIDDPTARPAPTFAPETDGNNMLGKATFGYQAWFAAHDPGQGNWTHWGGTPPSEGNVNIEIWPDVKDYVANGAKLYNTGFGMTGGGEMSQLFNSTDKEVIETHFQWLEDYELGGMAVQRFFAVAANNDNWTTARNHLQTIADAAEKYDKFFYVMYDLSGAGGWGDNAIKKIQRDFIYNVEMKDVASSTAYAHADGKPVVCLWGLETDTSANPRYPSASVALRMIQWFQDRGYFVIGGIPENSWATQAGDYKAAFEALDMLSPWMVGRRGFEDQWKRDKAWLDAHKDGAHKYYYQPGIYPGFGWSNIYPYDPPNPTARKAGQEAWDQMKLIAKYGFDTPYFAMFDEYDEGTAWMKAASDYFDVPKGGQYFQTMSMDGAWLSSDYYLRLASDIVKTLNQVTKEGLAVSSIPAAPPTPYSLGPVFYRNSFEKRLKHQTQRYGYMTADGKAISGSNPQLRDEDGELYTDATPSTDPNYGKPDYDHIRKTHEMALDPCTPATAVQLDRYDVGMEQAISYNFRTIDVEAVYDETYTVNEVSYVDLDLVDQPSSVSGDYLMQYNGRMTNVLDEGGKAKKAALYTILSKANFTVCEDMTLSFNIYPMNDMGRYAYIDLLFEDDTVDGEGILLSELQGGLAGNAYPVGEWTEVTYTLKPELVGRKVIAIIAAYDHVPEKTTDNFYTYFDDIIVQISAEAPPVVDGRYGDVNGDTKVDSTDARMVLQHEVELISIPAANQRYADVSADDKIDSTDARMILQYEVELIDKFPAEEE